MPLKMPVRPRHCYRLTHEIFEVKNLCKRWRGVEIVNVPAFQCYENTYSPTLILDFIWNKLNLSYEKKFTFIPREKQSNIYFKNGFQWWH